MHVSLLIIVTLFGFIVTHSIAEAKDKNYRFGTASIRTIGNCAYDLFTGRNVHQEGTELLLKSPTQVLFNFPTVSVRFSNDVVYGGAAILVADSPGSSTGSLQFQFPAIATAALIPKDTFLVNNIRMERLEKTFQMSFRVVLFENSLQDSSACTADVFVGALQ